MPLICSRARFGVTDPARVSGLSLAIAYRGGVIVYVNGQEIGRGHMPVPARQIAAPNSCGQVHTEILADDYPEEAFIEPGGKMMRTRNLTLPIPASVLRKGTNVLAIENRRSPGLNESRWPTSGLESVRLAASGSDGIAPNVGSPKGVYVWNAGPLTMIGAEVSELDPLVELAPLRLQAPLGGDGSGQVVVSADAALVGLAATCGDLTGPAGAKIPARAIQVRYAHNGGTYVQHTNPFDALIGKPMTDTKLQPVWVTAAVPASATPGTYKGTLALSGPTTMQVPIELTVYGWTLPDPRQWKTKTSFFQSPENLAKYYKVPLWSDAHFKLIEQSLILQGKLGDKAAHVLAVGADTGNASLGAETMVIYKRDGNKVTPDLTAVERYLKLYKKHVGDPVAVVLHVWTIHVDRFNPRKDRTMMATFRAADKLERGLLPAYEDPSIEGLWDEVVAGMKRTIKSLDWPENALMLGMSEDTQPSKETAAFFNKHCPDLKWALISHMQNLPLGFKLGFYIGPGGGAGSLGRGWKQNPNMPCTYLTLQRMALDVNKPVSAFRYSPINALLSGANGPGGNGLDRWVDKATGCYGLGWGQIMRGSPSSITAPGPDGAIPTVRYEMMRAGFCEAQAMIYVDENAANPKLPAPLAVRAKTQCDRILKTIWSISGGATASWEKEIGNLYQLAAEMQAVLGPVPESASSKTASK
jgi:hypothetical protein